MFQELYQKVVNVLMVILGIGQQADITIQEAKKTAIESEKTALETKTTSEQLKIVVEWLRLWYATVGTKISDAILAAKSYTDTAIAQEVTNRDSAISNAVSSEATIRQNADQAIIVNLGTETTARIAGDANLQQQINEMLLKNNDAVLHYQVIDTRKSAEDVFAESLLAAGEVLKGNSTYAIVLSGEVRTKMTITHALLAGGERAGLHALEMILLKTDANKAISALRIVSNPFGEFADQMVIEQAQQNQEIAINRTALVDIQRALNDNQTAMDTKLQIVLASNNALVTSNTAFTASNTALVASNVQLIAAVNKLLTLSPNA